MDLTTSAPGPTRRQLLTFALAAAYVPASLAHGAGSAVAATARTLSVSPTGSDASPGTLDRPLRTFSRALSALRPGDTLLVRGGTYAERVQNPVLTPGTPAARITVRAFPGERPLVKGLLWLRNPSFWDVSGIGVTWSSANSRAEHMVKVTGGSGWSLRSCEFSEAHSYAALLVAGAASDWTVAGNHIHDTRPSNGTNQDHLVYVNSSGSGGVLEDNVLVGSANGRAIKVGPPAAGAGTVEGLVIRYNTMSDNRGPSNVQLAWGTSHVDVHHNVMQFPATNRSAVTAYQLTGSGSTVHDNVVWATPRAVDASSGVRDTGGNLIKNPLLAGGDLLEACSVLPGYGAHASR
ncbi:hypothetical protein [Kineococcus rubinsiae]|uniref:hypothetical protein n=1 Tax=Kineococcus rubinsiae TaxID=2609562 RepID=UPI00142FF4F0|nr:hypothetical protein [Kineococcus rubinsiae]NIZ92025.1 hypothetical protein [Kineococcus rubinsiae]